MSKKLRKIYEPIDLSGLKTFAMAQRQHKVDVSAMAFLPDKDVSAGEFLESLPDFLGARQLRQLVEAMARAVQMDRPVIFAMGAHVIKVGCSPIIIDLMERGVLSGIVFNGAGGIHDFEIAHTGQTSEDVGAHLHEGRFGMTEEAPEILAVAAERGCAENIGLGAALGTLMNERKLANNHLSLLATAARLNVLATLHVALGTDTVHMHPQVSGEKMGAASMIDFRRLCSAVADLGDGGVWVNIGSAVILPEVFLKAVSVARNLGANLDEMVTANLDMQRHYRVQENVLQRPVKAGNSFNVIGHHEILLPLLRMWLLQLL